MEEADLRGANLRNAFLWEAHLRGADLTGAVLRIALQDDMLEVDDLQDEPGCWPYWPHLYAAMWEVMHAEACDPTTPPACLEELATGWPGIVVAEDIVRNPNISQELARWLAPAFPSVFLANPVAPLWFIADPIWLGRQAVMAILKGLRMYEQEAVIAACNPAVLALLEQCAQ